MVSRKEESTTNRENRENVEDAIVIKFVLFHLMLQPPTNQTSITPPGALSRRVCFGRVSFCSEDFCYDTSLGECFFELSWGKILIQLVHYIFPMPPRSGWDTVCRVYMCDNRRCHTLLVESRCAILVFLCFGKHWMVQVNVGVLREFIHWDFFPVLNRRKRIPVPCLKVTCMLNTNVLSECSIFIIFIITIVIYSTSYA